MSTLNTMIGYLVFAAWSLLIMAVAFVTLHFFWHPKPDHTTPESETAPHEDRS